MSRTTRATAAGRAYLDLQNQARRQGRQTQQLLTFYAMERWLARLSTSPHADQFVLKGGVLLAAVDVRRPTVDVDTMVRDLAADRDTLVGVIRDVAARPSTITVGGDDDGVVFTTDSLAVSTIREGNVYEGVRLTFGALVGSARVKIGLDVSVGDPITPAPVSVHLPSVRPGTSPVVILGYPLETVLAEKVSTAIELGDATTRVKDYVDLWSLTGRHRFTLDGVREALTATAAHRGTDLAPLSDVLVNLATARSKNYTAYRAALGVDGEDLPTQFSEVVLDVTTFVDPLVRSAGDATWDPATRSWGC